MVSPQNPSANAPSGVETTGRGFIVPEEARVVAAPRPQLVHSNVYWGSIIGGSLLTLSLLTISSLLAYACGVPAFSGGAYGWGAGIWSVISSIIAFFCGGMVSAYLSGVNDRRLFALHGLMAWVLAIPLVLLIFAGSFGLIGGHPAGLIATDVTRMSFAAGPDQPTLHTQTGAAWGSLISVVCGMVAALLGGSMVRPTEE